MMGPNSDKKSALKLSQLLEFSDDCYCLDDNLQIKIIKMLLEKEGDIDYEIPADGPCRLSRSYVTGYTALYLIYWMDQLDLFMSLLHHGADFTKKSSNGQTILHRMIGIPTNVSEPLDNPYLNAVLSMHVKSRNFSNPCNKDGLSHFHIACLSNNLAAVQFFLESGISVDEPVSVDAEFAPGFTPMHFAAMFTKAEVAKILMAYGANMHKADINGKTILHLLVQRKIEMHDLIRNDPSEHGGNSHEKLQEQIIENDKIINMLMENVSTDNDCTDTIGLSNFHVAFMLQDLSAAQQLVDRAVNLDHCVHMNSRLWPGYTALHFAAHVNIKAVEMLIRAGANLAAQDSKGITPLDICAERYKIEDIARLMCLNAKYGNLLFSDGQTKLVNVVSTLENRNLFMGLINFSIENINTIIPLESALWPGYSLLHLAVLFAKTSGPVDDDEGPKNSVDLQIIRLLCLKNGADLHIQDSRGRTALHLAYRLNKMTIVELILRHCRQLPNVLDEDNLSHLHIVCAVSKTKNTFKKCVLNRSGVNAAYKGTSPVNSVVRPGFTPLHVCVAKPYGNKDVVQDMTKILLKNGADLRVKDAYGLTPVHWLLSHSRSFCTNPILKQESIDCVAEEYGLSHLHVACHLDDHGAMKRFLKNGADVNLAIKYTKQSDDDPLSFLSQYDNYMPLNLCSSIAPETQELLMEYGAHIVVQKNGWLPLVGTPFDNFISKVLDNADLQRRMERKFGWTRLHLANYLHRLDGFEDPTTDVNAKVFPNSPLWKGYTPLHILTNHRDSYDVSKILLENGADVTVINEEQNSPIGMLFDAKYCMDGERRQQAALLMKYHKNFDINPVSAHGVSHFHVACYLNDLDAVRGFLLHGVDVNHPVDCFADWCPGYTPLHLASQSQVVELLLNYGADIHIENVRGCNVLSEALKRKVFDESLILKLIESGADINRPNFRGETPFEIAISVCEMTIEKLKFCIRQGCRVNSCNSITGVGYVSIVVGKYWQDKNLQKLLVEAMMNESWTTTISGRNALHHFVTKYPAIHPRLYALFIEKLIKSGCGIDEQDDEGKTALHIAVEFMNEKAVRGLLDSGSEINVADKSGNTALSYAFARDTKNKSASESTRDALAIHACRLVLLKLELSQDNKHFISRTPESIQESASQVNFCNQVAMCKERELGLESNQTIFEVTVRESTQTLGITLLGDGFFQVAIARLHKTLWNGMDTALIEKILEQEGNINYAIPIDSPVKFRAPFQIGDTALHHAGAMGQTALLVSLLKHGADFTLKNNKGNTALHVLFGQEKTTKKPLDNLSINAVLSAHVSSNNFSNPCNKDGLSHFHIACMSNNSAAVQFFLESGVSVDEPVSVDAEFAPGFTPIHFAVMYTNTKIAELLVAYGANMSIENARGMTPLHLLIEHRMEFYDSLIGVVGKKEGETCEKLQEEIIENEKIINMLMENMSSDHDSLDSIGLSDFHLACMLKDQSAAQHLIDRVTDLDHCVSMVSRLWPGYTALHFAAHVSIDTVEMLTNAGANLAAKDSKGLTPLDICIERYKIEDIYRIMCFNTRYGNLLFSDNQTKLTSFIRSLTEIKLFKKFIYGSMRNVNTRLPAESLLWPGYTPLHLAVLFAKKSNQVVSRNEEPKKEVDLQIIRFCLSNGADVKAQDSRGQTALHLAFRLGKMRVVEVILRHCPQIPNISDEDNLTHLHIVCAVSKTKHTLHKKFVLNRAEVNEAYKGTSPVHSVKPGSTPLHVCLVNPRDEKEMDDMRKILLKNGADPCAKDAYGLTPIHWMLSHYPSFSSRELLKLANDCVVEEYGISHLHVACHLGDDGAVKRLLENGADVNLAIKCAPRDEDDPLYFLSRYDKCTPTHLSPYSVGQTLVLEYGADVFAEKADGSIFLEHGLYCYYFITKVLNDIDLQRRIEREFGWTRLHLVCYMHQVDGFQDIVEAELTNINAKVFSNSPIWRGCTPLHLLFHRSRNRSNLVKILLENGADVTTLDEDQNTPVGMLFREKHYVWDGVIEQAALLLKYHQDFSVNPVSACGVSHFHVACFLNDLNAVQGFLSQGVDVNHPIDYFADWCPGYTPLHLASQLQIVDLLLGYGADVRIRDVCDYTVLHEALKRDIFNQDVVEKIIENGVDVNCLNFRGETPFQLAISTRKITIEKLSFCIEHGFSVNSCNPITGVGYVAIVLGSYYENNNLQLRIAERILNENSTNISGRTTLHHMVTRRPLIQFDDYCLLLEKVIKSGCDIDEQDNEGQTALHVAAKSANGQSIRGLLMSGADMNIVDLKGNSALSYALSRSNPGDDERASAKNVLIIHACRLALLKLELNNNNTDATLNTSKYIQDYAGNRAFYSQIDASKEIELGVRSIRLYDFLSETGVVTMYPSLDPLERGKIDRYFESIITESSFNEIKGILKLQYRKAIKRSKLLLSAIKSFRLLLGFNLPELCAENIFKYLSNADVKSIISAEIENDEVRMDF